MLNKSHEPIIHLMCFQPLGNFATPKLLFRKTSEVHKTLPRWIIYLNESNISYFSFWEMETQKPDSFIPRGKMEYGFADHDLVLYNLINPCDPSSPNPFSLA